MHTILVATDFSNASHNAFLYGLGMARAFGAKVLLFHAHQLSVIPSVEAVTAIPEPDPIPAINDRLRQHLLAIDNAGISIELLQAEGPASRTILETAFSHHADLIICGIGDHDKKLHRLFGSTASELAAHTTLPLIAVPEQVMYHPPHTIAFASDILPPADDHCLDVLAEIGARFHSKVYVVRVLRDRFDEVYELKYHPPQLHRLEHAVETQYTYTQHKHVSEALAFLIQAMPVHLLAMVPHKHTLLEKWFFKSQTKEMIFKTTVPLLVLPEVRGKK